MTQTTPSSASSTPAPFDVHRVREDFPILQRTVHGKPLVYLDNAASTQKPRSVIATLERYYRLTNANVHRGVHQLSNEATDEYEAARVKIQHFLGANDYREIVYTRGTTEAINLVAQSFARPRLKAGDEILVTYMEHHSNIVPWQLLCEQTGAVLKVVPIDDRGELIMEEFDRLLTARTKLVAAVHVSNALGTINPVEQIIAKAHSQDVPVLLDGAQAVAHMPVNVQQLDCDFYAFSGHKLFGPTGIGALYAKAEHLDTMPPYHGGGEMISSVTFEKSTWNVLPYKFEAGTPNIAGAIGLGAAIDYVQAIGLDNIAAYENELLQYGTTALSQIDGLRLIGTAQHKAAVLSFVHKDAHPQDLGTFLDTMGIAIRTGHHCAQPVMDRFGIPATARASLAFYNTREEIDHLARSIRETLDLLVG